jgi:hypothetical protein
MLLPIHRFKEPKPASQKPRQTQKNPSEDPRGCRHIRRCRRKLPDQSPSMRVRPRRPGDETELRGMPAMDGLVDHGPFIICGFCVVNGKSVHRSAKHVRQKCVLVRVRRENPPRSWHPHTDSCDIGPNPMSKRNFVTDTARSCDDKIRPATADHLERRYMAQADPALGVPVPRCPIRGSVPANNRRMFS